VDWWTESRRVVQAGVQEYFQAGEQKHLRAGGQEHLRLDGQEGQLDGPGEVDGQGEKHYCSSCYQLRPQSLFQGRSTCKLCRDRNLRIKKRRLKRIKEMLSL
jgi:hypothetical protein